MLDLLLRLGLGLGRRYVDLRRAPPLRLRLRRGLVGPPLLGNRLLGDRLRRRSLLGLDLRLGGFLEQRLRLWRLLPASRRTSRLLRLALERDRRLARLGLEKRRIGGAVEHAPQLHLSLLADELRRTRDDDVVAVHFADTRCGVVKTDLDELQLAP